MFNKLLVQGNTKTQKLYATAGSIADEVLTLVRTVISFGTQHKEAERYEIIHSIDVHYCNVWQIQYRA